MSVDMLSMSFEVSDQALARQNSRWAALRRANLARFSCRLTCADVICRVLWAADALWALGFRPRVFLLLSPQVFRGALPASRSTTVDLGRAFRTVLKRSATYTELQQLPSYWSSQ